jgi:dTDP-4-dehydrorhamnose reductase
MNTVLILGGGGMLGHKAYQVFSKDFTTYVSFRRFSPTLKNVGLFPSDRVLDGVDVFDFKAVAETIRKLNPAVVFNCVGIIKQLKEAHDKKISIYINSLLPHLLHEACESIGAKLIHISTDCVFSGNRGNYSESDQSDATDLYGRSKYLGEVDVSPSLTLRTSIIGHGLYKNDSLVDWFLSKNHSKVKGYTKAIYTGFPTMIFCRELVRVIKKHPKLTGLYNFSAERISKYELLILIRDIYHLDIEIEPYDDFICDRSLDSSNYRKLTGFQCTSWKSMIEEMHNDYQTQTCYGRLNETER